MKNKKLPCIYDYPTTFAIIGIMLFSSLFIGTKIAGLTLLFLAIWNFFATYYNSKLRIKNAINRN
ncbi:hypothetical protein LCGC14_1454760 [marine sediment metagenome]|uniref:Uncharacterized protein n=1 Tax=marine sediment metagenome TaxID=412755 RepID=A0A0F9K327_9ZZZZ